MSWLSQFAQSIFDGATGSPAAIAPTHPNQAPLTNALNAANQAGAALGTAVAASAEVTVNTFLTTEIGPVGADIADLALQTLIAQAASLLSPKAVAAGAHTTAVSAGATAAMTATAQ
jgi:hypothetical protein